MMKQIFFSNNVITPTFTRISILIKVKHDRQLFFRDRINPSPRNELRLKAKKKKEMEKSDETVRFTREVVTITQRARYRQRADKVECHDRWE